MIKRYTGWLLLFCLLCSCAAPAYAKHPRETKEKIVKATFNVSAGDLLALTNKYGNIVITNHKGNIIELEVEIQTWASTVRLAEAVLQRITIEQAQIGKTVSLKTVIEQEDKKQQIISPSKGFRINYNIRMPEQMCLELNNKFGNVSIENILGKVELNVKHGNLKIGAVGAGKVAVKFGDTYIQSFEKDGQLTSKHGNVKVESAGNLTVELAHGNFTIQEVARLKGEIAHGNTAIGRLYSGIEWESEFGNVSLKKIDIKFSQLELEVEHGNAVVNFEAGASYMLHAKTEHGNVFHDIKGLNVQRYSTRQSAEGAVNGGGRGEVEIEVEHGNIVLN